VEYFIQIQVFEYLY